MQGVSTIVALAAVMACGWFMKYAGKMNEEAVKALTTVLFWLLMPVGIFRSGMHMNPAIIREWRFPLVIYASFSLTIVFAWFLSALRHLPPRRRAVSVLMDARPNTIFIALPLLTMLMGSRGTEGMALYIGLGTPYYNFVPILVAQLALEGHLDRKAAMDTFKKAMTNPLLLSGILGIAVSLSGLSPLVPKWFNQAVDLLSQGASGLALLVIGASLKPERLWTDGLASWQELFMKLIFLPAVVMGLFVLFPMSDPLLMQLAVICSSVSPAFNCFIIARAMGMDSDYAASAIASTTIVGLFTSVFWIYVTPLVLH